jgi:hypothetical protein
VIVGFLDVRGVGRHRDLRRSVAESLGERDDIAAVLDPQRRMAVAQAVEARLRQTGPLERRVQTTRQDVAVTVRPAGVRAEDEIVIGAVAGP